MLKLKKTPTGWSASRGLMYFDAIKGLSGIEIKAQHQGMTFNLQAKSIAEAERKIAQFISAAIAEINAGKEIKAAEFAAYHQAAQAQTCDHEWVSLPVADHLNIVSSAKCAKCGEAHVTPRSN